MPVSATAVRMLLEAAEAEGIARVDVLGAPPIWDPSCRALMVDWRVFIDVVERLSRAVRGDPERLRAIGRRLCRSRSNPVLERAARGIVSVGSLYRMALLWSAPSLFPNFPITVNRPERRRIEIEGTVPEPYAMSVAFFHVIEGAITGIPTLLGLPPARVMRSRYAERHVSIELELPRALGGSQRLWRSVQAVLRRNERLELLEEQRRALAQTVDEMRRVNDEFRRVLDNVPDPTLIHRAGTILWVNRSFLELLGYGSSSEVIGTQLLEYVHESWRAQTREAMAVPVGARSGLVTTHLCRKDGEILIMEVSPAQSIVFGGLDARLVVGRDVSERIQMQQRLMAADRLSSLTLLAAGVAHEINNPLAYVLGSVENARRCLGTSPPKPEQALDALTTALEGVDRVRAIVRDLRVLSRADEHTLESVDVRSVLESTLSLAGPQIQGRARIVRDYHPVPEARVSAARLGQVFMNLMVNALESMHDQDVADRELRVRTSTDPAGKPVVEVSDTGSGIPPELVGRIFDPFFTTKPEAGGTGLGLAICQRIVEDAGGDITVDSRPGQGCTFRLTLPPASHDAE